MNTSKTISNTRPVGADYFRLIYVRESKKYLKDYIDLFNPDDYYIFKCSNKQKLVSYKDFLEFKWSSYIFFKKELYDINHINNWIDYWSKLGGIQYLVKTLPPFNPDKIIIKK